MNLSETLKKISPCDTEKPYVFVCYSAQDKAVVWQDVLEFQRRGYNVWLDEKNLDKTKSSWEDDAITAVEDMYCLRVIFYASKSSLVSDACYRELSKTKGENAIARHNGPVEFIAIDVDDIGNIDDFSSELHRRIYYDVGLNKDSKQRMFDTLKDFRKNFFPDNKKVRISFKDEENRKKDYYEEIVEYLPGECRNTVIRGESQEEQEIKRLKAVISKQEQEIEMLKDVICMREQMLLERDDMIIKLREQSISMEEKLKELTHSIDNVVSVIRQMNKDSWVPYIKNDITQVVEHADSTILTDIQEQESVVSSLDNNDSDLKEDAIPKRIVEIGIIYEAIDNSNQIATFSGKIKTLVRHEIINSAIKNYGEGVAAFEVLGIYDDTPSLTGEHGFFITVDGIYCSKFPNEILPFADIKEISSNTKDYMWITFLDNREKKYNIPRSGCSRLLSFLDYIIKHSSF